MNRGEKGVNETTPSNTSALLLIGPLIVKEGTHALTVLQLQLLGLRHNDTHVDNVALPVSSADGEVKGPGGSVWGKLLKKNARGCQDKGGGTGAWAGGRLLLQYKELNFSH